jgi:hypothetical protein
VSATGRHRGRGSSKAGRPRADGERYACGKLKPAGPNPTVMARRRAIAGDVSMAENPLDAALANGWLTDREHRAGKSYGMIYRQAAIGAPGLAAGAFVETRWGEDDELRGVAIRDMSRDEIAKVWTSAFEEGPRAAPADAREREAAAALVKWRVVNARLSAAVRTELFSVCIQETWPRWILERVAGEQARAAASAERRGLSDAELARIARKFAGAWERKRELLVEGLQAVARLLAELNSTRALPTAMPGQSPAARPPASSLIKEVAEYVDGEGTLLFTVERRGRR